ncbi:MAG: hypothetical protein IJS08_06420 [Victivallales bacterium]|nr:hypothetical protein [Victivallales bacterium]
MSDEKECAEKECNENECNENEGKEKKCNCKKKCYRRIGAILLGVLVVIIVALCALLIFLDFVVKTGIQTVGSTVTKCKVTVEHVSISILRGKVEMGDLVVGNPEGYKTESAFRLGKIHVAMNPLSLFMGKRTYIKEILIEDPEITYELNPLELTSNIGTIQKNVESMLPPKDEKKEEVKKEEKKEGRPIEIALVTISGGKIRLSATFAGGVAVPVPLPTITLNDIGKEKEITPPEATATVLDQVCTNVVTQAKNTTKSVEDAGKALGQSTEQFTKSAKALGNSAVEMGKSLFKSAKDKIQEKSDK